eukprot:CAMPEP_0170567310 /NCGR_PEP_ID=MMETSP0211-20121228/80397_1 /TAXON_ID=311385 /ORGANISM="Pseudokeronopsis sp., Strain OXSARD2" /LENGTH=62 /DNA_ID=CAMNT_0010888727 /DNA_START=244 /DNA_END=432 /DNA_ORIENTATION=-
MYGKALKKFTDAIKICGFNSELYYNIALCYFEQQDYPNALEKLEDIIIKAYEQYPQLENDHQ